MSQVFLVSTPVGKLKEPREASATMVLVLRQFYSSSALHCAAQLGPAMPGMAGSDLLECPVCLELFQDPHVFARCGHTFCRRCIEQLPGAP